MSEVWGWITPSRRFVPANRYGHLAGIGKDSELRSLVPNYDEMESLLDDIWNDCGDLIERGEHPEWHRYEMEADASRYDAMYKAGCLRVGTHGSDLCFEGTPAAIQNLYQFCKDFAEDREMGCEFEPRKY